MNSQNKKSNPKSVILPLVILIAVMVFNATDGPEGLVILSVLVPLIIFVMVLNSMIKKTAQAKNAQQKGAAPVKVPLNRPFPEPKRAGQGDHHEVEQPAEEAIHCAHRTGKQKYLDQIEGFLKNGLIDREEYKVLRQNYEKLNLPEDYH